MHHNLHHFVLKFPHVQGPLTVSVILLFSIGKLNGVRIRCLKDAYEAVIQEKDEYIRDIIVLIIQ